MTLLINLQLFAEGGEAAGTAGTAETGVQADPAAAQEQPTDDTQAAAEDSAAQAEERKKAYAQFKSDYKDEYDSEVQAIVKDRVAKMKNDNRRLTGQFKAISPVLETLSKKYGLKADDIDGIMNAYNNDDSVYEEEAYANQMSVEQVKAMKTLERENAQLKETQEQQAQQAQFAEWNRQAAELTQVYPQFNLNTELNNPAFGRLMDSGVDLRTCYEVVHKDELMRGAMQFASSKATEKVANSVKANKARPAENGLNKGSAFVMAVDVNGLSREQMEDYKRRAMAGERINFANK